MIREDVFSVENIWPYFIKQVKTDGKFEDASDDVELYHLNQAKVLDHRYQSLEKNVLDEELVKKQNEEIDNMAVKMQNLKKDVLPYNFQLWLVSCLVKMNDYQNAELIIGSMWGDEKLDLTVAPCLLGSLISSLDNMINPLF